MQRVGFLAGALVVLIADEAAKRLEAWLDDPEESGLFTRRDIADLAFLLQERKGDTKFVWAVVEAAMPVHDFPAGLEKSMNALYARFYSRFLTLEK
jgi:predicted nucleotidyltransferase